MNSCSPLNDLLDVVAAHQPHGAILWGERCHLLSWRRIVPRPAIALQGPPLPAAQMRVVAMRHRLMRGVIALADREWVRDGHVVALLGRKVPSVGHDLRGEVCGLRAPLVVKDKHAGLRESEDGVLFTMLSRKSHRNRKCSSRMPAPPILMRGISVAPEGLSKGCRTPRRWPSDRPGGFGAWPGRAPGTTSSCPLCRRRECDGPRT